MAVWTFGAGAGVHALVIGVGEYPWLVGGSAPLFADHEGMGQLTSAPESARAFATWIARDYCSGTHPLRSLELLVSEPQPKDFEPRPGAGAAKPERATFANVKQAVLYWRNQRLQPGDRALFYFCGHGLGSGYQHTLVMEDYGKDPNAALAYTMDFTKFRVAMARSPALEQCYFLDACRVASDTLMQAQNYYGDPILTPSGQLPSPRRKQPVFYATMPGDVAYGRPGNTSLFTEGLLRAMRGAGAARVSGNKWEVRTNALLRGLEYHVDDLASTFSATQNCLADGLQDFPFHELQGAPSVPVVLTCGAAIDVTLSEIKVAGAGGYRDCPPPVPRPWRFELPPGSYDFLVVPPGGAAKAEQVFPPFTPVDLP